MLALAVFVNKDVFLRTYFSDGRIFMDAIVEKLQALSDSGYRDFQAKLLPTVAKSTIIGVRTPALRA